MPPFTPALRDEYQNLFDTCVTRPQRQTIVNSLTATLLQNKSRYEAVGEQVDVPWYVIAVIHNMESSQSFKRHLHNGDPLTARTTHVPAGRPLTGNPPFTWEVSAIDALLMKDWDRIEDWTVSGALYRLESFNGFGSRTRGINTPYLWSFSTHYTKGKFVQDGVFDSNAVSQQCGAALLLRRMIESDAIEIPLTVGPSTLAEIIAAWRAGSVFQPEVDQSNQIAKTVEPVSGYLHNADSRRSSWKKDVDCIQRSHRQFPRGRSESLKIYSLIPLIAPARLQISHGRHG